MNKLLLLLFLSCNSNNNPFLTKDITGISKCWLNAESAAKEAFLLAAKQCTSNKYHFTNYYSYECLLNNERGYTYEAIITCYYPNSK